MTKRRPFLSNGAYTPKVIASYERAKALFNDDDADKTEFQKAADQLDRSIGRTDPWLTNIFETAGNDPPDWLVKVGGEQLQRWHDAKRTLNALEQAAALE
jgi:hypothetical protein